MYFKTPLIPHWEVITISYMSACPVMGKMRDAGVTAGKLQSKSAGVNPSANYYC